MRARNGPACPGGSGFRLSHPPPRPSPATMIRIPASPRRSLRQFLVCLLLGIAAPAVSRAEVWLFDFGGGNQTFRADDDPSLDPDNEWNNPGNLPATDDGEFFDAVNTEGEPTSVGIVMLSRFNDVNDNGTQDTGPFPGNATRDSWYANTEVFENRGNLTPKFKIVGLDPALVYTFTFYASRMGAGDNRETEYTVEGLTTAKTYLDVANNETELAEVTGMSPTAEGEVTISLAPSENNNNAFHFIYLGVLRIESFTPGGNDPVVILSHPQPVSTTVGQPVTFSASATGAPPMTVQWLRNGEPVEGANGLSYTFPAAIELSGSQYSVRISNPVNTVTSETALLTVAADDTPPTIASVTVPNLTSIRLNFSERVEPVSAANPANYSVQGNAIPIAEVLLSPEGTTVTLMLEWAISGSVPVAVSGLSDLAGNPLAGGTVVNARGPSGDPNLLLFDFGGNAETQPWGEEPPGDPVNAWNNVTASIASVDGNELFDLVHADGSPSSVVLTIISRFNGANTDGTRDSTLFPENATRDSLYGNVEAWGDLTDIRPVIGLSGLDPAKTYTLTFYASRMGNGEDRTTQYTITGAGAPIVASFNPGENIDDALEVPDVKPDATGSLTIALDPGESNNTSAHFSYLGVLGVKAAGSAPVQPPSVPEITLLQGNVARITWTGNGVLETSTAPDGVWTPVSPAPASPFDDTVTPGQRKFYRLRY